MVAVYWFHHVLPQNSCLVKATEPTKTRLYPLPHSTDREAYEVGRQLRLGKNKGGEAILSFVVDHGQVLILENH